MSSNEVKETIIRVFHQHGIPLGASASNVALAVDIPLKEPISGGQWTISEPSTVSTWNKSIGSLGMFSTGGSLSSFPPTEARLLWFTEQKFNWKLPLGDTQVHSSFTNTGHSYLNFLFVVLFR